MQSMGSEENPPGSEDPTRHLPGAGGEPPTPPTGYPAEPGTEQYGAAPAGGGDPYAPDPDDEGGLSSRVKFLIGALIAVIAGLIIGVALIGGSGSDGDKTNPPPITQTITQTQTQVQTQTQTQTQTSTVDHTVTRTATKTVTQTVPALPPPPSP
jgi:hypothetical protein